MAMSPCSPIFMTEPLPNCFSIWPSAISSALSRSTVCPFVVSATAFGGRIVWECDRTKGEGHSPADGRQGSANGRQGSCVGLTRL